MEYLGTGYAGFQRQPGKITVQGTLEETIEDVTGESVTLTASGRTDAGAHARHQVISFTTESGLSAEAMLNSLNSRLPQDLVITSLREVDLDFHVRFDAKSRTYQYLIWNRNVRSPFWLGRAAHVKQPLDADLMDRAAQALVGLQDMSAFIPAAYDGDSKRAVYRANVDRDGNLVTIEIEASGFMRQMVRATAGTLIRVGLGLLSVEEFKNILSSRRRELAGDTAPAEGLYLVDVRYEHRSDSPSYRPADVAMPPVASGSLEEKL